MIWRKWNIAAGWCQKSEEKRRKLRKMFDNVTTIEMSLKYVKAFRVSIDDHWTTYTSNIFHHPSRFGLEKGRTIVQYFWNPTPTQKPKWKVTGDIQNPSGFWDVWDPGHSWAFWFHQPTLPTSMWCIFSGSKMRWGTLDSCFQYRHLFT